MKLVKWTICSWVQLLIVSVTSTLELLFIISISKKHFFTCRLEAGMLFSSGNEISAVVTTAKCPVYFIVCFTVWFILLHASVTIEDISEEHPWETKSFTDARKHLWSKNTHIFYTARVPSTQNSSIFSYLSSLGALVCHCTHWTFQSF